MTNDRFESIDGLRAIAMSMVIVQHCQLLPFGWTGVWIFYVISGFVITLGLLREDDASVPAGQRWGEFMYRRFARIVPVYFAYVLLNGLILAVAHGWGRLGDLPYLLSFTYNWHLMYQFPPGSSEWGPFGPLWTLSVEEQFYLVFPLLLHLVPRSHRVKTWVALIILGPLLRAAYAQSLLPLAHDLQWNALAVYTASFCHFDAFLMGALLAVGLTEGWLNRQASRRLWWLALGVATAYAVAQYIDNRTLGAVGSEALRNIFSGNLFGNGREVFVYTAVDLLAAALVTHLVLGGAGAGLLRRPWLVTIGKASFGGYLFHPFMLWLAHPYFDISRAAPVSDRMTGLAVVWTASVLAALVSFRYFETPVRRWLLGLRAPTGATPSAARSTRSQAA